ncbi:MAG: nicotinate phosphoribosyltransferase [Bacteroidales bacterium]|nr:nicotinate phosphoribosyltransferase [Bacteroidales bacterium]MDD4670979.1 nicotinate phosphoribosyltransferase [Bacteroidales bacterium]
MSNYSYCSDKYQYTMGKSFYDNGMKDKIAVFNLFFRSAPDNNNWAVVSGIKEALEMIAALGSADISFFEQFLPGDEYREFREYLSKMKFTGKVYAMKEGEIVFPREPVLTIVGPIIEAQVLETPLLCIMNHQMAIATKASRVTRATKHPVSEFGSRRAHGPWAAVYGAKAAFIGGCLNSSNILTATKFGFQSSGTMAHSYTTSFGCSIEGEYHAFDTYIKTHKNEGLILLVDTFDTLKCGLKNAIRAFKDNGIDDSYTYGYGIRLDSGDLAYLSRKCREELDAEGLLKCRIFATNSLDEYIISDLEKQDAKIDSYGVGDAIATSKHNPCFGNVYKLVQVDDEPVLKRSEDKAKLINPGFQITYRIIQDGKFQADVTCLRDDSFAKAIQKYEEITITAELDETKITTYPANSYTYKQLQDLVYDNGVIFADERTIFEKRDYYLANLRSLNETQTRIINPHYYKVDISDDLYDLKMRLINKIIQQINHMSELADKSGIRHFSHVVVDMLYDFIDGSLACLNSENAVRESVGYINSHPDQKVFYVLDHHPANHCSFKEYGGIWPAHCVMQTKGGDIHSLFYTIENEGNRPSRDNKFYKGTNPKKEQYSGFESHDREGIELNSVISKDVIVSGIATEYCIRETCFDLVKTGHNVFLLENSLGYIDEKGHNKVLRELSKIGVKII